MPKWIELNNGDLVNIDVICNIRKENYIKHRENLYSGEIKEFEKYSIAYDGSINSNDYEEDFAYEKDRDKRFEEIKAMLLDKTPETDTQPVKVITATDIMIEEMNLSYRAYNCLKRAGVRTLDDVIRLGSDKLLKVRNLGKKSYDEIVQILVNRYHQPQRNWESDGE